MYEECIPSATLCVFTEVCGFESHLGQLAFSFKRRESEPSQVVVLCCLAFYWIGLIDLIM